MKKGFTLLELLIGITIFAIISGAIYVSLYLGIKVYKHEAKSNSSIQAVMLTFRLLEKSLYSAFMNPANEDIKFKGSAERVDFFAVNKNGQLESVSFYLEPAGTQGLFSLLSARKTNIQKEDPAEPVVEVINNRISAFKLSYYDIEKKQWLEDWSEELSVPGQVKAEIDFVDSENAQAMLHLEKYISIPIANEIEFSFAEDAN